MADEPKCPTCHSLISLDPNKQTQGSVGVDAEGKPIPRWTDDPIKTPKGFSGADYKGQFRPRKIHIEELQADRQALEAELKIEPLTDFSLIDECGFHVRKTHLIELRESTEKILAADGSTLTDYFKLDADGNEIDPGPNDTVKTDWTDVQRGATYLDKNGAPKKEFELSSDETKPCPTFPDNTRIRAIHIEDLRHALVLGWREFWAASPTQNVKMPEKYTVITTRSDVYDYPGAVPNYPGISYGKSDRAEYSLLPSPSAPYEWSGTDSYDPRHHFSIKTTPTETGKFGFPSGLDIHTSDGGNKFIYQPDVSDNIDPAYGTESVDPETGEITFVLDRVWITQGYCRTHSLDYIREYYYSGGTYCPNDHYIKETYGGAPTSNVAFEIIGGADSLVSSAKPDAKTLKITVNADSSAYVSGPMNVWYPPQAWGYGKIYNLWQYGWGSSPISRGIYHPDMNWFEPLGIETKANRYLKINKDTCFKFFANVAYSGAGSKSNPNTGLSKSQWASVYMYEIRHFMASTTIEEWGSEPSYHIGIDEHGEEYAAVGYGYACCFLYGMVGGQQFILKIILDKVPDSYPSDAIAVGQGKYDGQSYTFAAPWGVHSGERGNIAIFLGEGNAGAGRYDFALNFEDIFYAWSQIYSSDFGYYSHKTKNDKGEIVEDPSGSYIDLMNGFFYASSYAGAGFKQGSITGHGYPGCGITVKGAEIHNTTGAVSLELSAIRVQNNLKRLQDT